MLDYNKTELEKLSYFVKDSNDAYLYPKAGNMLNLLLNRLHEYSLKVESFMEKEKAILLITKADTERKPSFDDYIESEFIVAREIDNGVAEITLMQLNALYLDLVFKGYA
jgi:hypothetical protein